MGRRGLSGGIGYDGVVGKKSWKNQGYVRGKGGWP